ncbi:MAG TPA: chemotaxis protein CheA [Casimicrobiaceae bacterium]|jgi:two-component system chemotaxis sensor kinase CheA
MDGIDADLLQDFVAEATELLDDVDRKLIELEQRPEDHALLNDVFRGFHTIKGGAGFLGCTGLVEVCHRTETLFDRLRKRDLTLTPDMMDAILAATAAVRAMFDEIARHGSASDADVDLVATLERWAQAGKVAQPPMPAAPAVPLRNGPDWNALHAALVPPAPTPARQLDRGPAATAIKLPSKESTLRVDVERFDQILNLSGEIGLTKNRLVCLRSDLVAGRGGADALAALDNVVNQLAMLVGNLQSAVMKARMQPVGRVFQKYVRMARDLGRQLGKDVELAIEGEATEIDKTMLEELNDPLVHLVRNAVDHGVDTPQERVAAGKPVRSVVRLCARQAGDTIEIDIEDDGRGMQPEKLRRKAVEKGLLSAADAGTLDDRQALNLVFMPGFSTKDTASDLSGRGVGMDVVKTNIQRLSGSIALHSTPGRGTRVSIRLPLTLAILPVLMFRLQTQAYALPLSLVGEIVRIQPSQTHLVSGHPAMLVRGQALPIVDVAAMLGRRHDRGDIGIVVHYGEHSMVLAVDSFVGQDEVVIKALEGFKPRGVAGATLASDGALVLVLDLSELLHERGLKAAA